MALPRHREWTRGEKEVACLIFLFQVNSVSELTPVFLQGGVSSRYGKREVMFPSSLENKCSFSVYTVLKMSFQKSCNGSSEILIWKL